jgi:hypothetical protein
VRLSYIDHLYEDLSNRIVAYNRVALTEYFQHRSIEKVRLIPSLSRLTILNHFSFILIKVKRGPKFFLSNLRFFSADWYARQDPERFLFYTGEAVVQIDTDAHIVRTSKGRNIPYHYCVLVCLIIPSKVLSRLIMSRQRALKQHYLLTRPKKA